MDPEKFKKHLSKRIKCKNKIQKQCEYIKGKISEPAFYDVNAVEGLVENLTVLKDDFLTEHNLVTDHMEDDDPDTAALHKDVDALEASLGELITQCDARATKTIALLVDTKVDENTDPQLRDAIKTFTLPLEETPTLVQLIQPLEGATGGTSLPGAPPVVLATCKKGSNSSTKILDVRKKDQRQAVPDPTTKVKLDDIQRMIFQRTAEYDRMEKDNTEKEHAIHHLKNQRDKERDNFLQQITDLEKQLAEAKMCTKRAVSTPAYGTEYKSVQFNDTAFSNVWHDDDDQDKSCLANQRVKSVCHGLLTPKDKQKHRLAVPEGVASMNVPINTPSVSHENVNDTRYSSRHAYLQELYNSKSHNHTCNTDTLPDASMLATLMTHNNTLVKSFIEDSRASLRTQQETNEMPKSKLPIFDGDPLSYWAFMKAFDDLVGSTSMRYAKKLNALLTHCSSDVKKVLAGCQLMLSEEGYSKARSVLRQKYGNPFLISQAWKNKLAGYCRVNTPELLETYSEDLVCCYNTLAEMGYVSEMENSDCLSTISSKLDNGLRSKWRKLHRAALRRNEFGGFRDLVELVMTCAEEQNDPVYNNERLDALSGGYASAPLKFRFDDQVKRKQKSEREPKKHRGSLFNTVLSADADVSEESDEEFNNQILVMATEVMGKRCVVCSGQHYVSACPEFQKQSPKERLMTAKSKRLCLLCLNPGHYLDKCTFKWKCQAKGCVFRHNNLLHGAFDMGAITKESDRRTQDQSTNLIDFSGDSPPDLQYNADVCLSCVDAKMDVDVYRAVTIRHAALPITPVIVFQGKSQVITYALLDSGSTATICTQRLIDQLKPMSRGSANLTINTIHGKKTTTGKIYNFEIKGVTEAEILPMFEVVALDTMPISSNHIAAAEDLDRWPHLKSLPMANVEARYVDLLIGQDNAHLIKPRRTVDGESLRDPFAVITPLGWTIYGLRSGTSSIEHKHVSLNPIIIEDETTLMPTLETMVEKLWSLEKVPECDRVSPINRKVLQLWDDELTIDNKGYIQLPIPLKKPVPDFPNNRPAVLARLRSLGKRLQKDKELHMKYKSAMQLNFDKGYAIRVTTEPVPGSCWNLTQLPVVHKRKPGVVRPVWNGGFVFQQRCLNDEVHQGPDQTNRIVTVMANFRLLPVAIMGDIKQIYNQVKVPKHQQDLMRFLYWEDGDPDKQVIDCCLTYHMFGGGWSPSICCYAVRKIIKLAKIDPQSEVARTIMKAFYVDDCVKCIKDTATGITLFKEITTVLGKYHFDFTKLVSNKKEVTDAFPEEKRAAQSVDLDFDGGRVNVQHSLGQRWQPDDDVFFFVCCFESGPETRRELLSTLSSLYDPLGLCAPFLIPAKRMLQELTKLGLAWDDKLPTNIREQWQRWVQDSVCISEFRVPRWVQLDTLEDDIWLVYFSDASEVAYGATCYVCTIKQGRIVTVNLLMTRSRLAPMKSQSIPRLELCAALVAAQLDEAVQEILDVKPSRTIFWTDSMLVLRYIHSEPSSYKTFISNRISAIQQLTSKQDWKHVPTDVNPADCLSRGISAKELVESNIWLHGPGYLLEEESNWPQQPDFVLSPAPEEERKKPKEIYSVHKVTLESTQETIGPVQRHELLMTLWRDISTWDDLVRRVAWVMFAITKFKKMPPPTAVSGVAVVNCDQMQDARLMIIGAAQDCYLSSQEREKKSFIKLFPRTRNNLVCIGGRLERASLPTEFKQPYVLPTSNRVTTLFIKHCHDEVYHAGVTRTLMQTRKTVWILSGRREVKAVVDKCIICKKYKSPPLTQMMADLPPYRLKPGVRPFEHVGIDYMGPLQIKQGRSMVKRYVCVIVCSVTRAIHLESATELTTSSFLNAFSRFIARRGKPSHVLSDNGTNFVGAKSEMSRETKFWNAEGIHHHCADKGIEWKFNPPAASHFGGMWERHNRTIRSLMLCMAEGRTMDEEVFHTLLCLIEFSLNSRPLTKLNDDPSDPSPLTPNLILLGDTTQPLRGMFFKPDTLRNSWKRSQYLADAFWRRWLHEYLDALQKRTKWLDREENLKVGSLVLVVNDNMPRHTWPLGLVVQAHKGSDGLVRAAEIKTETGVLTRPIVKIVLLEADLSVG